MITNAKIGNLCTCFVLYPKSHLDKVRLRHGKRQQNFSLDDTNKHREEDRAAIRQKIEELLLEHRDLDDVIHQMFENTYIDQLQLKRLKKWKLAIKDRIEILKSRLLPGILA